MSSSLPPLSSHRRARLETWAGLWLLRLAGWLSAVGFDLTPHVDRIARLLLDLLILRVNERVNPPQTRSRRPSGASAPALNAP